MKAAVYYRNSDVRIEERPLPAIGPGEALVKVMAAGICGSDVLEWYRVKAAPVVLGHENAGVVEESKAADWKKGDRVIVSHHVPCNACKACTSGHHAACEMLHRLNVEPGGFAEYIRVPKPLLEQSVLRLPEKVSFAEGSFVEPLGCVVRAQRLAGLSGRSAERQGVAGSTVLVLWSGTAGLLHIKLAKASGAGRVVATDIAESRLAAAERAGADATVLATEDVPAKLREVAGGLADLVIVCAGSLAAATQALRCVERGGTVLLFAVPKPGEDVPLPANELWKREIRVVTSYAAAPADMQEALELIASGKVRVADLISHRLPLAEAQRGFMLVVEGKECAKVVLEPHG